MDMQFVSTNENALNHYISGYMSKPEKSNTEAIWNECNKNKSNSKYFVDNSLVFQ